jgi:hypothetical protein
LLIPTEVSALIFSCASYPRLQGALDPCFVAGKSTNAASSSSPPARTAANTCIPMPPAGSGLQRRCGQTRSPRAQHLHSMVS